MSHEMQNKDVQFGLAMAWHKLTKVVKDITKGLLTQTFEYVLEPIIRDGEKTGWSWLVGSDDQEIIGIPVSPTRSIISNERFEELVHGVLEGTGAKVVSIGTFGGRCKRYASIEVGTEWERFKVGNREFQNLLNIHDSVDGSLPLIAKGSNTCVVCANTFAMSLGEKSEFRLSVRHTKKMESRIENFTKATDAYRGMSALYQRLLQEAETVKVDEEKAHRVFVGFLGEGREIATRTKNQAERMRELFVRGAGAQGRSGLDLIGAVTDYYTHESSGKRANEWSQVESSEIGSAMRSKSDFLRSIRTDDYGFDRKSVESLAILGDKSLSVSLD